MERNLTDLSVETSRAQTARAGEQGVSDSAALWPTPIERKGIALFFLTALIFGGIVEMRSAFLQYRMTDLDVYLRAAWAVRTGHDLYAITDDRYLHYHYPPLFAILMIPLADAPRGQSRSWMVPYAAAVAIWYGMNLLFLAFAVNQVATALERAAPADRGGIPPPGSRSWWSLRLLPILICIGPVGVALERGQADLLLLALVGAMIAAIMARRSAIAGWCLAGAICLKLFPAYLLVYPIWRRDFRLIAACGLGLLLGLILIPLAYFGPARAQSYAREWNHVLIEPALLHGKDRSRATELLDINATDSQSFVALVHRWYNLDETLSLPRPYRSRPLEKWATAAHWVISILLTALTLLAAGRVREPSPFEEELILGCLTVIMVLSSPVSHLHYLSIAVPLTMGLLMAVRGDEIYPRGKWVWLLAAVAVCGLIPLLPGLDVLRDLGLEGLAALSLWAAGTMILARRRRIAGVG